MNKKKFIHILKIILINIVLLCLFGIICEILFYNLYKIKYADELEVLKKENMMQNIRYTKPLVYNYNLSKRQFRTYKGTSSKRPIIFLGCSYIFGSFLNKNQVLAAKVNKLTNRTTYRRGICGVGIKEILDQLATGVLKKEIPDAEYIIYTYIDPHITRLYSYQIYNFITYIPMRYKLENDRLVKLPEPKFKILYSLFSVKLIQYVLADINESHERSQNFPLFLTIMEECMKYFKEQYPNTKIVVLLYPSVLYADLKRGSADDFSILPTNVVEYLEDLGYIVINAEDLTDEPIRTVEYRTVDGDHPNEKAWDAVAPGLVKKLNL